MEWLRSCLRTREENTSLLSNSNSIFSLKNRSYPRIIANIAIPILLGFSGYAAYQWRDDKRVITASYLSMGALVRFLMEVNLPETWNGYTQTITSKSFFEIYEILWNIFLNASNLHIPTEGQEAILDAITALGGFGISGDWLFLLKLQMKDRIGHTLAELDLEEKTVNPIVGPSFEDNKGQLILKSALTVLGIGLATFSYFKDTGLNVFYRSLGFFLTTHGLGFFLSREWVERWRNSESKDEDKNRTDNTGSIRQMTRRGSDVSSLSLSEVEVENNPPVPSTDSVSSEDDSSSHEKRPDLFLDALGQSYETDEEEVPSSSSPPRKEPIKPPPRLRKMGSEPALPTISISTPASPLSARTTNDTRNRHTYVKVNEEEPDYPDVEQAVLDKAASGSPLESRNSLKTKMFRGLAKVITGIGLEALTFLYLIINNPYAYLPAGFIYGGIQYLAQRKFQVMTNKIYQLQQEKNMTVVKGKNKAAVLEEEHETDIEEEGHVTDVEGLDSKKTDERQVKKNQRQISTALKIERAASGVFLLMFLGWFIWGAEDSQFEGRLGVIIIMLSYLLTGALAIPVDKYFKPEKNGMANRVLNHLRYVFYHNPYSLAVACFSLIQITEINDQALKLDSLPKYICGLIALSLFSSSFALNRMRSISTSGFTTTAAPLVRMLLARTLYDRATNVFGV